MGIFFEDIVHDAYLRILFPLAFLIVIGAACLAVFGIDPAASRLILHFTPSHYIDAWGTRIDMYGITAIGALSLFLDASLANFLYRRERFLSYALGFIGLGVAILIFIAVSVIVSVN